MKFAFSLLQKKSFEIFNCLEDYIRFIQFLIYCSVIFEKQTTPLSRCIVIIYFFGHQIYSRAEFVLRATLDPRAAIWVIIYINYNLQKTLTGTVNQIKYIKQKTC